MGLSIAAPIGPVNIEVIRRGLRGGFVPALLVGCGSTAADLIYVAAVYVGIAPFVQRPLWRILLDVAAALVFGLLSWESLNESFGRGASLPTQDAAPPTAPRGALASGFLITLFNPMTVVLYVSLFGGAVAALHEAPRHLRFLFVASVVAGCLLWSLFLALLLGWGKGRIRGRMRRGISGISALALGLFAARFLVQGFREIAQSRG